MPENPYNPLDKIHLGESVANAILQRPVEPLPPIDSFPGAGVYLLYYTGSHPLYSKISERNRKNRFAWPIYVGKAVPPGARRGSSVTNIENFPALFKRLVEHGQSVDESNNLDRSDFFCRHLVVDDIWIPLGESLLIQRFSPIWNSTLDGFGNHDPGKGRYNQQKSPWDVLHPGRKWAEKCRDNQKSESEIEKLVVEVIQRIP